MQEYRNYIHITQDGSRRISISDLIRILRFPLAVCVVMVHCMPDANSIEHGLSDSIRQYLLPIVNDAVPLFFMISGYLFFVNIDKFTWNVYRTKMRSRINTILLPYLLWNLLYLLFYSAQSFAFPAQLISGGKTPVQNFAVEDFLLCFWRTSVLGPENTYYPIYVPLWFLRDLFLICLASPVIYLLMKYLRKAFPVLLLLAYLFLNIDNATPIIRISPILNFMIGAYIAMIKVRDIRISRVWRLTIPAVLIFTYLSVFQEYPPFMERMQRLVGMAAISTMVVGCRWHKWLADKSRYSMIIYVMHGIWLNIFIRFISGCLRMMPFVLSLTSFYAL